MTQSGVICPSAVTVSIRRKLRRTRPFIVSICGDAGSGKTTLLESTLKRISQDYRSGVIVANPKAQRDTARLRGFAHYVAEVPAPQISDKQIRDAFGRGDVAGLEVLFVESIGGPTGCTRVEFGQDVRIAVFSVSGGDDKAAEFPDRVHDADLVLLNKMDLLPHVAFDGEVFRTDARRINPGIALMEVSAAQGAGLDDWERWLRAAIRAHQLRDAEQLVRPPELFLG